MKENKFKNDYKTSDPNWVVQPSAKLTGKEKRRVKIKKLHPDAKQPEYKTNGSSGMDLVSIEDIKLKPGEYTMVRTGLSISLPRGYEGQIRPRSGLAAKHGVTVLNTPGTIDSDFRGELQVILINLSNTPFFIEKGSRMAQLVIAKCEQVRTIEVQDLDKTGRGEGGFGSTGK